MLHMLILQSKFNCTLSKKKEEKIKHMLIDFLHQKPQDLISTKPCHYIYSTQKGECYVIYTQI